MVRKEKEESELLISFAKDITLVAVIVMIFVHFFSVSSYKVGIYSGCPLANRFTYSFFHTSVIHLFLNLWCFVSVAFLFPLRVWSIGIAFMIAFSFPVDTLSSLGINMLDTPTIGFSGVCFALLGDCSHFVKIKSKKIEYHLYIAFFILLGFCFNNVNQWIHLYCYMMGCWFGYNSISET